MEKSGVSPLSVINRHANLNRMASKRKPDHMRRKPYRMVRIPEALAVALEAIAVEEFSTITEQIRNAAREYLAKRDRLPKPPPKTN